jgi:radical SAM superfamily enzyme YgiQ (UPF0313 family)
MADLIIWNSFCRPWEYANSVVSPISPIRPVGPHQLSSWARNFGYHIKVIDFSAAMSTDELVSITEKNIDSKTIAIGASTTFWIDNSEHFPFSEPTWAINARRILEARYPKLEWILGGPNIVNPVYYTGLFRFKWVKFHDYAENKILKYLDEKSNSKAVRPLFDIKCLGNHFTDENGITKDEVLPLELGRGCQFKCSFCRFDQIGKKKGTYIRNMDLVEKELLDNYHRYGTTRYYFVDDTVNESEEKVIEMAEMASRLPFKLEWVGYNRLDLIWARPNTIELLKQSGLRSAYFGIESFNPYASRIINKGWNSKHAKEFLLKLMDEWKGDITWQLSFIIGLPGESLESIMQTQQWCIDTKQYSWLWHGLQITKAEDNFWPSEFDKNSEKYGYVFPNPTNNPNYWINGEWNAENASELAKNLMDETFEKYDYLTSYLAGEVASVGKSFDEVLKTKRSDFSIPEFENKTRQMIDNYVKYQLNL